MRILVSDAHTMAALGAVRSLGQAGHQVTLGCVSKLPAAATASRYLHRHITQPNPWRAQQAFVAWLAQCHAQDSFDFFLPTTEAAVFAAQRYQSRLANQDLRANHWVVAPSAEQLRYTLSKFQASQLAAAHHIKVPNTAYIAQPSQWRKQQAELVKVSLPCIVKTDNFFYQDRYHKGEVHKVHSASALHETLARLEDLPTQILVQECIEGDGVGAFLLRGDNGYALSFCHQRLHEVPYTGGASSLRQSLVNTELEQQAKRLLDTMEYRGVAMVEFRRCARTGQFFFLEINGRLWGSIALALHCNQQFPAELVALHKNNYQIDTPAAAVRYPQGLRCRNVLPGEIDHLLSIVKAPAGAHTPNKVSAAWRFVALFADRKMHYDHLWRHDPGPAVRQFGLVVRDYSQRLVRKLAYGIHRVRRQLWLHQMAQQRVSGQQLAAARAVLFLCHGNIYRSPLAAQALRQQEGMDLTIKSAGFHPVSGRQTPSWFQRLCRDQGLDLADHRSKEINQRDVQDADLVFVMDYENYSQMRRLFPNADHPQVMPKVYLLGQLINGTPIEIADPYLLSAAAGEHSMQQILQSVEQLASARKAGKHAV